MSVIKKYKILGLGVSAMILYFLFIFIIFPNITVNAQQSAWTIQTLKEYYDKALEQRDKLIAQKFESLQIAVDKAEAFSKEKFANTNEWRNTLESLGRTYMPRTEQESKDRSQDEKINTNTADIKRIDNIKQGGINVWAIVFGITGILIAAITLVLKKYKL